MRRSVKFSSPSGTHILSITLMLSCIGSSGSVSFTDIEVIPDFGKFLIFYKMKLSMINSFFFCILLVDNLETNKFNSASEIVANCPSESSSTSNLPFTSNSVTSGSNEWTIIQLEKPSEKFKRSQMDSITLGTHVSLDRLAILEKNLNTWTGPVSLVVFVPVKEVKLGLEDWQR